MNKFKLRSSLLYERASGLVVNTKLKPSALLVHKGVTFRLSSTVTVNNSGVGLTGSMYRF